MSNDFEALPWHDAELLSLTIDRREAGYRDEVQLRIAWPDKSIAMLLFCDCYAIVAEMNFGVIAAERIADTSICKDDPELERVRLKWKSMNVSLDKLRCYRLETASTGSVIRIYAQSFRLLDPSSGQRSQVTSMTRLATGWRAVLQQLWTRGTAEK